MKKVLLLVFTALPFFAVSQYVSAPPIIAYDNCEIDPVWEWGGDRKKKWTYWTGSDHILPGTPTTASMNRSANYVRRGNFSYKARITKDLTYSPTSNTVRSEMIFSNPQQPAIGWRWAAVSVYIPEDFCQENAPISIAFSTKASPDDYETPFRLDTRNGRYYATRASISSNGTVSGGVATDLGPIDRGKWVDWVYNRNFTQNSSGYQRLYKNGVLVWSYNGPNWVTGSGRNAEGYMPMGLYKWVWYSANGEGWGPTACNDPIEVYYDEYRFGDAQATLQNFLISTQPPLTAPFVFTPIPDQGVPLDAGSKTISLANCFRDEKGVANLTYSITGNSNTEFVSASLTGNQLTLTRPISQIGSSTIKIRATDADGKFSEDEFIIATITAPVINTPIPNQSVLFNTISQSISLSNVFTDDKGAANISFSASVQTNPVLISNASVNGTDLSLTLIPGQTGTATIKVRATDSDGLFAEDEFDITIEAPVPVAPNIANPIPDQSVVFNTTSKQINLADIFSDDEGPGNLSYTVTENSNQGLVTSAAINGTNLTLTIASGLSGTATIKIKATDSDGLFIEDDFSIVVEEAVPVVGPSVPNPIPDRTIIVNIAPEPVDLINVFSDDKGPGNITYAVSGNSNPGLITNATISGTTLTLTIAPGQSGTATIKIKATDSDGLSAEDEFHLNVEEPVPVAPTVSNPVSDQTVPFNTASKQISLDNVFNDDEGTGNISFSISGNSNHSLITGTSFDGTTLTLTIAPGQSGITTIKIKATDSDGLFVEDEFEITVEGAIPVAPAISNPVADQSAVFNSASKQISLASVFSDDEGLNNLSYSVSGNSNSGLITNAAVNSTMLTLTIAPGQSGSATIKIKATDSDGLFVEDEFDITVEAPLPVAPTVSNPVSDQNVAFNTASKQISLANVFNDDEGNGNISFSVSGNSNSSLITGTSINGTNLTLTIAPGLSGIATIKVKATDSDGLFVEDEFDITVEAPSPVAPTVSNPVSDQTVPFNTASKQISLDNVFNDDEGTGNISLSISGNSNHSLITGTSFDGTTLTLTIAPGQSGTTTIKVKATDSDGLFVEDEFEITVEGAIPVAPAISNPVADQSAAFNSASKQISLASVFSDDEGLNNLSYSVSGNSNSGLITNAAINSTTLTLTIAPGQSGIATIKIKATDSDGLFVEDEFDITVEAPSPVAPTVSNPVSDQTVPFNTASKQISLANVFNDDEGNGNISFSVSGNSNSSLITGTSINGTSLTLTIAPGLSGIATIKVKATDSDGLFAEDEFDITIDEPVPVAPFVSIPINNQSSPFNTPSKQISLANVFDDDESTGNLSFSVSGNSNSGLISSFSINGSMLTLTIAPGQSGTATIKVKATDSDGLFVEDEFDITVEAPIPVAPTVSNPISNLSAAFNTPSKQVSLTNVFIDDEGANNLSFSISGNSNHSLITGTSFNGTNLILTIAHGQSGTATIKIKATDSDGLFVEDEFDITIEEAVPVAPTVSNPISDQGAVFNSATRQLSLANTFSDDEGTGNLSFSVSGNSNPGLISGTSVIGTMLTLTIAPGQSGTATIKIKATDSDGLFVEDEFDITVEEAIPVAPTVSNSVSDQSVPFNTASKQLSLTNVFSDDEGANNLSFNISGNSNNSLITGTSFNGTNLILTIAQGQSGTATIKVKATDSDGLFVEDEFDITVEEAIPVAPTISNPISDLSVPFNTSSKQINLNNVFYDDEGANNLSFSISGNPNSSLITGTSFNGAHLILTIAHGQSGTATIKVKATDSDGLFVEDEFDITVAAGSPPLILNPISDQTAAYNSGSKLVSFSNAFTDDKGTGNITYSISGNSNLNLISNISINSTNITLTIAPGQSGSATIKVKATDSDGLLVEDEFEITVEDPIPVAPVVSIPINNQSAPFNTSAKQISIANTFSDDEGLNNLTYSVSGNSNSGLITNASINGTTLTLTIAPGQSGTATIKVKATDSDGLFVEDEFDITIEEPVPVAPFVSIPINNQSSPFNTPAKQISIANTFSDDEGLNNLTYAVSGNSNSGLIINTSISGTTLTLTIAPGQSGTSTIKVKATDSDGLFVEDEFDITVEEAIPVAPTISNSISDESVAFNTSSKQINLVNTFSDDEGFNNISFSVSGNSNSGLITNAAINSTTLTLTIAPGKSGTATIKVKATDSDGLFIEDEFDISVEEAIPVAPTISNPISDQTVAFNTASKQISLTDVFSDDEGLSNLSYAVSGNSNSGLITNTSISGTTLTLTITPGQSGTATIKVKATDSDGLFVEDEFDITIDEPVPVAPFVSIPINNQSSPFNTPAKQISIANTFSDDEGLNNLAYSVSRNSNSGLITSTSVSGTTLTLTIAPGQSGTATIKVKATDSDGLFVEDEFDITVEEAIPVAPTISNSISDESVAFNTSSKQINLVNTFSDDEGLNNLTYSVSSNSNSGLITNTSLSGTTLTLTIAPGQSGAATIKIKATDSDGLFVEDEFDITVEDAIPVAPTLSNPISDQSVAFNTASKQINLANVFSDDQGIDNLSFGISGNSDNLLITGTYINGTNLTLTIAPGQSGTATIKLKATDSDGLFVEDEFAITVEEAIPVAPTVSNPIADQTIPFNTPSKQINLSNVFSDDEGLSNLSYAVNDNSNSGLITNASINGTTLTLTIAPGQSGAATIKIKATDSDGLFVEDEFDITVEEAIPVAPIVSNPISNQSVAFNTASKQISLASVFSDDEGLNNLSYTVNGNSNSGLITNASINSTILTLIIAPGQSGTATIKVKATDSDGLFVEDEFDITIDEPVPVAPFVSIPINNQSSPFNTPAKQISIANTFSDDEGLNNLTYSVSSNSNSGLITNTSISGTTLTLTIAPGQSGTATIKIKATDSDGLFVEDEFDITVEEAIPVAPTISNPISDQTVAFNTPSKQISLTNVFSDDEGLSNLSYSVSSNSNSGLITNTSISGTTLTLTTAASQSGTATIKVKATDSDGLFVEDEFAITVEAPLPVAPTVSNPVFDQNVPFNTASKQISLASVFSDDEGLNNLSYTVNGNSNPGLITNASVNSTTLTLTIASGQSGTATIKIKAIDSDGLFAEDEFVITVAGGSPPVIANPIPDQSAAFNSGSKVVSFSNTFTDDKGAGNITYSISGNSSTTLITNATISGTNITLTIASGQSGTSTIKLKATDSDGLFAEDQFVITVAGGSAPVIANPIPDQSAAFNSGSKVVSFSNTFTDDKGAGNITYSISGNSSTTLITNATISGTNITLTIASGQSGTSTIKLKATDSDGLFAEDQFVITVAGGSAPVIASPIPDQSAAFNSGSKVVSFSNRFTDDEGAGNISYSISGNSNTTLITNATISGTNITLTIASGQSGTSTIKLKATDSDGLFAEDQFVITVAAGSGPVIASPIPDQSAAFNSGTKVVSFSNRFTDDEGAGNISYSISGNSNTTLITNATISGTNITLTIASGQSGTSTIKLKATDSDGLFVEDQFVITVAAGSGPVIASPIPDQSAAFNSGSKVVSFSNRFTDDKGTSNISYSISGNSNTTLITNATISGTNITLTIASGQSGTSTIKLKATDSDGLFVEDQFVITVAGGSAPVIANPIPDQSAAYNSGTKVVSFSNTFTDDKGAGNISYSISGNSNTTLITNATISGTNITLTIGAAKTGTSTIKIKATDSDGLFVEDQFVITVAAAVAPVIANPIPDQSAAYNTASKVISLSNVFTDEKGASNITYSVSGNSNTTLITNSTVSGTNLTLTIGAAKSGTSTIKVKATDSDGLFAEDQFVITVAAAAPVKILINSGGPNLTYSGDTWAADKNFSGGTAYSYASNTAIGGTLNDVLYTTERYGAFNYTIPVTNGKYTVILHFAELHHTAANKRKFNVNIENSQGSLSSYDIFAKAGGAKIAKTEQFIITVSDGNLNIGFTNVLDNAKVSAIEILTNTSARIMNSNAVEQELKKEIEPAPAKTEIAKAMAFPNPFTDRTQISLKVTRSSKVKMEILNFSGQLIAKYAEEFVSEGMIYRKEFAKNYNPAGVYYYRITTDKGEVITGKIVLQ